MDKVIDFQIPAEDTVRAEEFYKKTFGWMVNRIPEMQYTALYTGPTDKQNMQEEKGFINGGLMKKGENFQHPCITINVESIAESVKKIRENGGTMIGDKMNIGDMGSIHYFKDTEGNVMCLWENRKK